MSLALALVILSCASGNQESVAAIRLINVNSNDVTTRIDSGVNSSLRIRKIERSEDAVFVDEAVA